MKCKRPDIKGSTSYDYGCRCEKCTLAHKRSVQSWRVNNKEQNKKAYTNWNKKNERSLRNSRLKRDYGITLEWYEGAFDAQGGRCAVCRREQKLVVDHSHRSKKVRGLLCGRCNTGIGFFQDNASLLSRAADYLLNPSN